MQNCSTFENPGRLQRITVNGESSGQLNANFGLFAEPSDHFLCERTDW